MKTTFVRSLALLGCGGLIGYSIHLWHDPDSAGNPDIRFTPITTQIPVEKFTEQQAEQHRQSRFESLATIKDILSLPGDFDQTEALYALAGRSDTATLKKLIEEASQLAHSQNRRASLQILISRYAELAPQQALALLNQFPASDINQLIHAAYYHWAKVDINGALHAALDEPGQQRRQQAARSIFQAWQHDDPQVLEQIKNRFAGKVDFSYLQAELLAGQAVFSPHPSMEQALQLGDRNIRQQTISRIAMEWTKKNPREAYQFAKTITDKQAREAALNAIFSTWSQTEAGAEAAFKLLTQSEYSPRQNAYFTSILNGLATTNPERALNLADQLPTAIRQQSYQTILQNWGKNDIRAAVEKLDNLPNHTMRQQLQYSVLYQYASQYPQEALEWAGQATGSNRRQMLNMVVSQMANSDPELALTTALSFKNSAENAQLLNSVLHSVARQNPQLAAGYVDELPAGQYRRQALNNIAIQWINSDPDAAFDWVSTLEGDTYRMAMQQIGAQLPYQDLDKAEALLPRLSESDRQHWIPGIASARGRTSPQQAAEWIQQFSNDKQYPQLVQSVAINWAQQDPAAALNFVADLPESQRLNSVNSIISTWAGTDVQAAANWVSNYASSKEQEIAAGQIAWQWANHDFESARQWAGNLSSGAARDNAFSRLASSNSMPSEQALRLLRSIENKALRSQAVSSLFYRQLFQNREAALELLDHPDLDPNQKKAMEASLERGNNPVHQIFTNGRAIRINR